MRIRHLFRPGWNLAFASLLCIAALGCSDRENGPTEPIEPPSTPDLEAPLGGFTAADEEPAFGEPAIAKLVEAEIEFEDPIGDDPEFATLVSDPRVRSYAVSILWGRLDQAAPGLPDGTESLDWSGRLRISRGAILLERVIDFEQDDAVMEQRFNARELRWTSHAAARHDGLRLSIWNRNTLAADSLFFETGPYSGAWSVEDLASIDLVATIAGTDQQIAIRGMPISGELQEGFAQGYWRDSVGAPSEFAGRWMGARGEVVGFVRGIYGSTVAGERVLFGKWIDREGTFRGFLRGTWDRPPDSPGLRAAEFDAQLLAPAQGSGAPQQIGRVMGRWRIGSEQTEGAFEARWCLDC